LYVNLSAILSPFDVMSEGMHDSPECITAAVLNDPEQVLILVLRPDLNETTVNITISGTTKLPRM
jgi:hypothetical protein